MERFRQTTFSNLDLKHRRGDDDASFSEAVNICESCGFTAERLSTMPAYKLSPALQACDQCMAEDELARNADLRMVILSESGCTPAEAIAFIKAVA